MSLQLSTSRDCRLSATAANMCVKDLPSREKLCVESADEFLQQVLAITHKPMMGLQTVCTVAPDADLYPKLCRTHLSINVLTDEALGFNHP